MATLIATTASNEARVLEPGKAHEVLKRYFWDGEVQAVIRSDEKGEPLLSVFGYDWPSARLTPEEGDEPDWDQNGDEGFGQFLLEIAPLLAEPLIIQAVGAEACRFPLVACQWTVQPAATDIQIDGFPQPSRQEAA